MGGKSSYIKQVSVNQYHLWLLLFRLFLFELRCFKQYTSFVLLKCKLSLTLPHTGCLDRYSGPGRLVRAGRGGRSWSFGCGFYKVQSDK